MSLSKFDASRWLGYLTPGPVDLNFLSIFFSSLYFFVRKESWIAVRVSFTASTWTKSVKLSDFGSASANFTRLTSY